METINQFILWTRGVDKKLDNLEQTLLGVGDDLYNKEEILRVDQVAELFNKTELTIKEWSREGIIPAYKHPKTRDMIFFKNEIIAQLKKHPLLSREGFNKEANDFLAKKDFL